MEEKKNLFPSKDTEKKYRNIMILHIQGIVLVIVLMLLLAASFSIMFRSIFTMGIDVVGGMIDIDDIMFLFEEMGFKAMAEGGIGLYKILSVGLNIISYGGAIITIVATIVIFIQMKKRIAMILDENEEKLNIVKVKKAPYFEASYNNHDEDRERRLLLHKREIRKLKSKCQLQGLTCIPTKAYFKNGRVKLEIALAKGKNLHDKRMADKQKTMDRYAKAALKR